LPQVIERQILGDVNGKPGSAWDTFWRLGVAVTGVCLGALVLVGLMKILGSWPGMAVSGVLLVLVLVGMDHIDAQRKQGRSSRSESLD
jgi:hypothetical protein